MLCYVIMPRPGGIKRWCCLTSVPYIRSAGGVCGRPAGWRVLADRSRLGRPSSRLPLRASVAGLGWAYRGGRPPTACYSSNAGAVAYCVAKAVGTLQFIGCYRRRTIFTPFNFQTLTLTLPTIKPILTQITVGRTGIYTSLFTIEMVAQFI